MQCKVRLPSQKEVGKNREAECLFETYELYRKKAARLKFYDENKGLFTSGADKQVSYASRLDGFR